VWFDVEGLLPNGFEMMATHVASFFHEAGIEVTWRIGDVGEVAGDDPGVEIPIVLLLSDRAPERQGGRVLGATRVGGPPPRPIWVFLAPLCATLGHELVRRGPLPSDRCGALARPLARVVTHEIVHSLAPSQGHALSGLMKHSFSRAELLSPASPFDARVVRQWLASVDRALATGEGPAHN
jgi:hypothetical protein